ncbi:MAG: hypothetical protein WKF96_13780 [Solirubrobacteraceae bacterium]
MVAVPPGVMDHERRSVATQNVHGAHEHPDVLRGVLVPADHRPGHRVDHDQPRPFRHRGDRAARAIDLPVLKQVHRVRQEPHAGDVGETVTLEPCAVAHAEPREPLGGDVDHPSPLDVVPVPRDASGDAARHVEPNEALPRPGGAEQDGEAR